MRRLLALLALLLLAIPPVAHAGDGAEQPTLLLGSLSKAGWVGFRLESDGSPLYFGATSTSATGGSQIGWALYDTDDRFIFSIMFTGVTENGGHMVEIHPAEGIDVSQTSWNAPQWGRGAAGATVETMLPPGSYKVLLWLVSDVHEWTYEVRGGGATELGAPLTGTRTWFLTSRDFEGAANVQAFAEAPGTAAFGGRAQVDTRASIDIEHRFVGAFLGGNLPQVASVETDDATSECPCGFSRMREDEGALGPGRATFHLTGAGAGMRGMSEAMVVGVDARLPE